MFILLKSSHLRRLCSSLEHLGMMALRHLLTPQTSSCSWPRIYTGIQRRSPTQYAPMPMPRQVHVPFPQRYLLAVPGVFPSSTVSLRQRAEVQKARKPSHFGT